MFSYYRDQLNLEHTFAAPVVFSLTTHGTSRPRILVGRRSKVVGEPSYHLLVATMLPIYHRIKGRIRVIVLL
jgi:hypothetical protein